MPGVRTMIEINKQRSRSSSYAAARVAFGVLVCLWLTLTIGAQGDRVQLEKQAETLDFQARRLRREGKPESHTTAIEKLTEAKKIYEQLGSTEDVSRMWNGMGMLYSELYNHRMALDAFQQAFRLVSSGLGKGVILDGMGSVYADLGDDAKAIECLEKSLTIRRAYIKTLPEDEAIGQNNHLARTIVAIGEAHFRQGRRHAAFEKFTEAAALLASIPNKTGEDVTLTDLGDVFARVGDFTRADEYYKSALERTVKNKDRFTQAIVFNRMGIAASEAGDKEKAREHFNKALFINQELKNRPGEALTLNNIGETYSTDPDNAIEYFERSRQIMVELGDKPNEALLLNNLAYYTIKSKGLKAGLDLYAKALEAARASEHKRLEALVLFNMADAYNNSGDRRRAIELMNRVLVLVRELKDDLMEVRALYLLMTIWEAEKAPRFAIFYGKQAVNILQATRSDIRSIGERTEKSFVVNTEASYRKLAELLIRERRIAEAERVLSMIKEKEYSEYSREGDLKAAIEKRMTLSVSERELLERYDAVADELTRLGGEYSRVESEKNRPGNSPEQITKLVEKQKELDEKLSIARKALDTFLESLKAEFSREDKRIAAVEEGLQSDVKSWQDPSAVAISTIVGKERLSIIVTTANIQTAHVVDVSEDQLNAIVAEFRRKLRDPKEDPRPQAQALYDKLIAPIETDLDGVKARTLVWSLDGLLRYVPMSALWDAKKGFLVQRYSSVVITLASRGNLGKPLPSGPKAAWKALGVGVSNGAGGSDPLKYVPEEINSIVYDPTDRPGVAGPRGVMQGRRLLDGKFTYDAFLGNLGRFPVVHAATHFTFVSGDVRDLMNSYLQLGSGERLTLDKIQSSGTIFDGVQLLALSACETAFGGKGNDGRDFEGFGAMAQKKGARAVLATLWSVADESTSGLMVDFYRNYRKPAFTKAEALRQAQLHLLSQPDLAAGTRNAAHQTPAAAGRFVHPFYWSPFILIGNWK